MEGEIWPVVIHRMRLIKHLIIVVKAGNQSNQPQFLAILFQMFARELGEDCPFDPVAHGLDQSFRLTNTADLKGWGCKVPQNVLLKLLEGLLTTAGGDKKSGEEGKVGK